MKQLAAIIFSLLLIVAQTFAVPAPVSSGVSVAKRSCCGDDCQCCVGQSQSPSAPPIKSAVPAAAQNQFVFLPVAVLVCTLTAPADEFSPASFFAELRVAKSPLFQRNCVFLI